MGIADSLYSQPKYIIHLNDNQQMFIKILSGVYSNQTFVTHS